MTDERSQAWTKLCAFTEDSLRATGVPGASVGVLHEGAMQTAGFGVTNAAHPLPVTDETFHQIGSITKTYTGTVAMRFVEEGKLDLDATVRSYLPEFRVADEAASAGATVRHLMTHTGGWAGDLFEGTSVEEDALEEYVARMANLAQLAPLGTVWSYNNAGFAVLGRILEVVGGKRYAALLAERLLEPLGLTQTHLETDPVITARFAVGHRVTPAGAQVIPSWSLPGFVRPMGAIQCTVKDLLRYARFHLGGGTTDADTQVLTGESLTAMHAPQLSVWGDEHWGLTWSVDETGSVRRVMHGGGTSGQISLLTLVPERAFAVGVLTNADRGSAVTRAVTERALAEYLDVTIDRPTPIASTEDDLAPYVGRHTRPFAEIELGLLGGRLIGQLTYKQSFPTPDTPLPPPPPPMSLVRCAEDRLLVQDGPLAETTIDVLRRADGTIGWIRASSRIHRRVA